MHACQNLLVVVREGKSLFLFFLRSKAGKKGSKQMGRMGCLRMISSDYHKISEGLIESDHIKELKVATKILIREVIVKLGGFSFNTIYLKWVASIAAIYLLIMYRRNRRTNMPTSLLVPYIFFSLPPPLFKFFRGDVGKWIASTTVIIKLFLPKQKKFSPVVLRLVLPRRIRCIAVVLRLFLPQHLPGWLKILESLILLLVVSPHFLVHNLKHNLIGVLACLIVGCYLLQDHIHASGGFRKCFTHSKGILITIAIILLISYPVWALVLHFFEAFC